MKYCKGYGDDTLTIKHFVFLKNTLFASLLAFPYIGVVPPHMKPRHDVFWAFLFSNKIIMADTTTSRKENKDRKIRFKLSLTGIEFEIIGYKADELSLVNRMLSSRLIWLLVLVLFALLIAKASDWIGGLINLWPGT